MIRTFILGLGLLFLAGGIARAAEDRNARVRDDRDTLKDSDYWIYNDLPKGLAEAKRTGKPLLVVVRCIP